MAENLAVTTAGSTLTRQSGRAIIFARNHHIVVDAPSTLNGPNEAITPIEVLLGALAACAPLVFEALANELKINLKTVDAEVRGEYDPQGAEDNFTDPSIHQFHLTIHLTGVTPAQSQALESAYRGRCPVYATLVRAAPVEIEIILER